MALSSQILRVVALSPGVALLALSVGCSTAAKRPVFYPNNHIKQVGQAQARRDTNACMALADKYEVSRTKDGEVATRSVEGALLGGVSAGAWGIVRGDAAERAAAGALAGGSAAAVKGGIESTRISPTFQRFVQRCLREKGYDLIGWE